MLFAFLGVTFNFCHFSPLSLVFVQDASQYSFPSIVMLPFALAWVSAVRSLFLNNAPSPSFCT